mgnify:CR=1 FL=1
MKKNSLVKYYCILGFFSPYVTLAFLQLKKILPRFKFAQTVVFKER